METALGQFLTLAVCVGGIRTVSNLAGGIGGIRTVSYLAGGCRRH